MSKTFVRKASIEDLDAINRIFYLSKKSSGYDDAFMNQCMRDYSMTEDHINENSVYMFYVQSIFAGFYYFDRESSEQVELDYFFLHPDFFGQGIGRQLWNACIKTARESGIDQFFVHSDPNAEGFYLNMGCQKIGEEESPMSPGRMLPMLMYLVE